MAPACRVLTFSVRLRKFRVLLVSCKTYSARKKTERRFGYKSLSQQHSGDAEQNPPEKVNQDSIFEKEKEKRRRTAGFVCHQDACKLISSTRSAELFQVQCKMGSLVIAGIILSILSGVAFCTRHLTAGESKAIINAVKRACYGRSRKDFIQCELNPGRLKME